MFWTGYNVARGQERINVDKMVAEVASHKGFRVAGVRYVSP